MITLYQQQDSGNCYKVRLVLAHLDRPFQTVAVSALDGSTRRPEFLARNPIGKVPTVRLDDGRYPGGIECDPAASCRRHGAAAERRLCPRQGL